MNPSSVPPQPTYNQGYPPSQKAYYDNPNHPSNQPYYDNPKFASPQQPRYYSPRTPASELSIICYITS